jgi:transporter family-2 protein
MQFAYVVAALIAGAVLPLQALINARLAAQIGGPILASAVSFQIGAIALFLLHGCLRLPWPASATLIAMPIWFWVGGFLGACYVTGATMSVPKLGAAGMVSLVIVAQVIGATILDQTGFLAVVSRELGSLRILGAFLLLAGAVLVVRF